MIDFIRLSMIDLALEKNSTELCYTNMKPIKLLTYLHSLEFFTEFIQTKKIESIILVRAEPLSR